ncbi:Shikimate kinase 2 [Enhygromyxa salina]|uniref:Shikimate kinase n=1 Tax=Enhygromyxa salina TaxID=215803 RepID=A0A2S9XBA4_9BACT|nr:Shikimate kinase 2 [Enhygromyxa salina]
MVVEPVFLLGMMGAGKSSVGRELAREEPGATFIDLDARIELLFGASVEGLFAHGEDYFRACERAALRSLVAEPGFAAASVVVATGGGVVIDPANLQTMGAVGTLVYLEADVATLTARLSTEAERRRRPLLGDAQTLTQRLAHLLEAREPAYRQAHHVVDARESPQEVATRVRRALSKP